MKKYLSRFIMYGVTALSLSGCAAVAVPFVAGVVYKYHDEIAEMIGDPSERKVKTSKEIYSKDKKLASKKSIYNKPYISNFRPYMSDMNGVRLSEVKGGQTVKLGMKYQVNIPMYSKAKTVKVTDYNTLVLPDGRKMDQPKLTRNRVRLCEEVYSDVSVKIYDNVPLGPYVHIASVEINGRRYEERQILNIIKRD